MDERTWTDAQKTKNVMSPLPSDRSIKNELLAKTIFLQHDFSALKSKVLTLVFKIRTDFELVSDFLSVPWK